MANVLQGVGNAAGLGLNAFSTIMAAREGRLPQYTAQLAAARGDPATQAQLVNSPFTAGTLGLFGGQRALPNQPLAPMAENQVAVPQQFGWVPRIPLGSPEQQVADQTQRSLLDLALSNPAAFRSIQGTASPADATQLFQSTIPPPDAQGNPQLPAIGNMTVRSGNLGMYQQPIPWPLLLRAGQSLASGGPGVSGYAPFSLGGMAEPGQLSDPSDLLGGVGWGGGGIPQPGALQPPRKYERVPNPPPAAAEPVITVPPPERGYERVPDPSQPQPPVAPPQPPTVADTTPSAPALPEGAVPFDPAMLDGQTPLHQRLPKVGFAPPAGGAAAQAPVVTPAPAVPRGRSVSVKESTFTPEGTHGGRTRQQTVTDYSRDWQSALDKQRAQGLPETALARLGIIQISDNSLTELVNTFAPGGNLENLRNYTGPGRYTARKNISLIPFVGESLSDLTGGKGMQHGRFRKIAENMGLPMRLLSGAALTPQEMATYRSGLNFDPTLPYEDMTQNLRNYANTIATMARDALWGLPALDPAAREILQKIVVKWQPQGPPQTQ